MRGTEYGMDQISRGRESIRPENRAQHLSDAGKRAVSYTHLPYGNWGSRKYLIASLDQSLKRLGLDYVDIFYHHRMDPETPLEETMEALAQIVRSGKALYVGISNYDGETMKRAADILEELHCPFIINQNSYNIFNRTIEKNGLKQAAAEKRKGIISFSPLAQGMLDVYKRQV